MNKFSQRLLLTTAAVMAFSATDAKADSINANATANVVADIEVTETTALDFGTFSAGASAGTVAVNGSGTVAAGGAVKVADGAQGVFDVSGVANTNFSVSVDASVTLNSGGNSMTAALTPEFTSGATNGTGDSSFTVDGVLTVGSNQAVGSYAGTYAVTVSY